MATLPTPEQCASEILAIFVCHFGLLAGDILRRNNFLTFGYRETTAQRISTQACNLPLRTDGLSYSPVANRIV